jgi:opacity protein-like surface antigen
MRTKWSALLLAACGLLLASGMASAESSDTFPGDVPNNFRLFVGGEYAWFNTTVTFQQNLTPGGPIGAGVDLEGLGLLKSSAPGFVARGYWNFLGRFFLDFGYTGFRRNTTKSASVDIPVGDVIYTAGASVAASTSSDLPYLDFRYDFIKNEHTQLGVSLGASYVVLKADLSASAGVIGPGGPIVGQTVTQTAKEELPVPLLGLKFDQQLGEGLSAGIVFNGIFAPVSPYTGAVFDGEAHVDWFMTKNFGLSAAFDYQRFSLKREDTNTYVKFQYSYYGPRLYLTLTF